MVCTTAEKEEVCWHWSRQNKCVKVNAWVEFMVANGGKGLRRADLSRQYQTLKDRDGAPFIEGANYTIRVGPAWKETLCSFTRARAALGKTPALQNIPVAYIRPGHAPAVRVVNVAAAAAPVAAAAAVVREETPPVNGRRLSASESSLRADQMVPDDRAILRNFYVLCQKSPFLINEHPAFHRENLQTYGVPANERAVRQQLLLDELMRTFVDEILDVTGDGNCGFYAVAEGTRLHDPAGYARMTAAMEADAEFQALNVRAAYPKKQQPYFALGMFLRFRTRPATMKRRRSGLWEFGDSDDLFRAAQSFGVSLCIFDAFTQYNLAPMAIPLSGNIVPLVYVNGNHFQVLRCRAPPPDRKPLELVATFLEYIRTATNKNQVLYIVQLFRYIRVAIYAEYRDIWKIVNLLMSKRGFSTHSLRMSRFVCGALCYRPQEHAFRWETFNQRVEIHPRDYPLRATAKYPDLPRMFFTGRFQVTPAQRAFVEQVGRWEY